MLGIGPGPGLGTGLFQQGVIDAAQIQVPAPGAPGMFGKDAGGVGVVEQSLGQFGLAQGLAQGQGEIPGDAPVAPDAGA